MNAFGFFLRRFAWQFGIRRERARWNSLTRETQLLAEAQDLIGKLAWPETDKVEGLSGEYWQLRDLDTQQSQMRELSDKLTVENEAAEDRLYGLEEAFEVQLDAIRARKAEIMQKAVAIMDEVEGIKERDSETRRRFNSMKAKLEVLKKQEGGDFAAEIERTRQTLATLKDEHSRDLAEISAREGDVQRIEQAVQKQDAEIADRREKFKDETAELVSEIGRRSKQIAELSAKIGAFETNKGEISFQVGQYLSNQIEGNDPNVRAVLNRFRPIVSKIRSLRRSIQYNQRLARRTRG